jgi:hypothetical protein
MALITYPNKNTGDPFTAAEATEIKSVVNANYTEVSDAIDDAVNDALESGAVADALALKAPIASPTFTGSVSGITSAMVGLSNVNNTSDVNKPVSTAQQTALDLKANLASPTFTGTVTAPLLKITSGSPGAGKVLTSDADGDATWETPSAGTTIDATPTNGSTNAVQSNGVFDELALKAPLASPTFTGTVAGITASMVGLGSVNNTADSAKPVSSAQQTAIDAKVADAINNGTTTVAPSQNAVFDALALKISTANLVWNEVPTGTINGSNTIYTVAIAPVAALVVSDGRVLSPSSDYTLVGTTLTFGVPPISQVLIFYLK